jgi:RNA polymerase sigma-70 factor (ECF subfamily)
VVTPSLSRTLLAEMGLPAADGSDLEPLLTAMLEEAVATWSSVEVARARFLKFVAARLPQEMGPELERSLRSLDGSGLYLACACADGDADALAAFEERILTPLGSTLRRLATFDGFVDELKQRVRTRLFVGGADGKARIDSYRGQGDLASFARVLATREALALRRPNERELLAGGHEQLEALVRSPDAWPVKDPEMVYLRKKYEAEFVEAFRGGVASLSSNERNLLRYHYLNRLSIDHIGAILGIHRVSAARRLNKVRDTLVTATRQLLRQRLHVLSTTELDSVLRLIESDVDVSLGRALAESK